MAIWDIKERYELARGSKYLSNVNGSGRILYKYSSASNTGIQSLNITNGGTSTDFGEMTVDRGQTASMSSTTRGVCANGAGPDSNVMDYVTISTEGNAADFGDSTITVRDPNHGTIGNNTRGIRIGGASPSKSNVIDFITIANTGNATDFGDATTTRRSSAGASSKTRGLSAGGGSPANDTIDFITMATTGNATDFGNLTETNHSLAGNSNGRIATFAGMNSPAVKTIIDTVTISTTGNATDFGDLSVARGDPGDGCNSTKAAVIGGYLASEASNTIDIHIFATGGTATDYGDTPDATVPRNMGNPAHGGIDLDDIQLPSVTYMPGSGRGFSLGGAEPDIALVDMLFVPTLGAISNWSSLSANQKHCQAVSSSTRIINAGTDPASNVMESIEIASQGNEADFGDLTGNIRSPGALSNATRGVFGGGNNPGTAQNVIQYVTIATAGNATDFGDLTVARAYVAGGNSPTRGLFGGGSPNSNVIDYITIGSTGDATDFGDLSSVRYGVRAVSNATRCVFMAGTSLSNVMEYVTIASAGDVTDFGDLLAATTFGATCQTNTRGCYMGGETPGVSQNVVQYMTIASTGNTADWGDLSIKRQYNAGASDGHGGLQG